MKKQFVKSGYDIIGDIHASAKELRLLMSEMGYSYKKNRGFVHPSGERQLLFVGDFINKGKDNEEVLCLLKPTIENSGAVAVMGNHECNEVLKSMRDDTDINHGSFVKEFGFGSKKHKKWIGWFKDLPVFHHVSGEFMLLHAQFNSVAVDATARSFFVTSDFKLRESAFEVAKDTDHKLHQKFKDSVGLLLWGTEIAVPDILTRSNGTRNSQPFRRVSWWHEPDAGLELVFNLNESDVTPEQRKAYAEIVASDSNWEDYFSKPQSTVFCGHIPRQDNGIIGITEHENIACLDIKNGIVGYRYNLGDQGKLFVDRVVHVTP